VNKHILYCQKGLRKTFVLLLTLTLLESIHDRVEYEVQLYCHCALEACPQRLLLAMRLEVALDSCLDGGPATGECGDQLAVVIRVEGVCDVRRELLIDGDFVLGHGCLGSVEQHRGPHRGDVNVRIGVHSR
jgi:hypothetical protein